MRWAFNLLYGTKLGGRVYGPKITSQVGQQAALQEVPIYLYGSRTEVLEKLVERLQQSLRD